MKKLVLLVLLALAVVSPASSQSAYISGRRITIVFGAGANTAGGVAAAYSPADSAVDYIGVRAAGPPGATGFRRIPVPTGTWYVVEVGGSVAKAGGETSTTETSTIAVFKNATTSLGNVGTIEHPTTNALQYHFDYTDLNLGPLVGTDYFELRLTHPVWVTNPTSNVYNGVIVLERRD